MFDTNPVTVISIQVYLVTGGEDGFSPLSFTEVLTSGAAAWELTTPLPSPLVHLRAATLDNKLIVTSKYAELR